MFPYPYGYGPQFGQTFVGAQPDPRYPSMMLDPATFLGRLVRATYGTAIWSSPSMAGQPIVTLPHAWLRIDRVVSGTAPMRFGKIVAGGEAWYEVEVRQGSVDGRSYRGLRGYAYGSLAPSRDGGGGPTGSYEFVDGTIAVPNQPIEMTMQGWPVPVPGGYAPSRGGSTSPAAALRAALAPSVSGHAHLLHGAPWNRW